MNKDWLHRIFITAGLILLAIGGSAATSGQAAAKTTNVADSKQQLVDIVLRPKSQSALHQFVYNTVTPSSPTYRKFVSPSTFAKRFSQSPKQIKALQTYLRHHHLKAQTYKGNLIMVVKGSTKNVEKAFKVNLVNVNNGEVKYQKASRNPQLPKKLSKVVYTVFGLSNYSPFSSYKTKFQPSSLHTRAASGTTTTKKYSPTRFVRRYNLQSLYDNGSTGRSKTIGIISFANFHPNDVYRYWDDEGINVKSNRLSVYRTNGFKGTWDGYDETTIDVEQAGAIAPDSNIRTYIARPNILGMVNSIAAAVGQNVADSLSLSWGQSEAQVAYEMKQGITPKKYNQIMNLLFEQAAAQGMSVFTATGDNGAYDGITTGLTSGLSVDTPSNSPYVTAVGGTTLPKTYTVNKKKVTIHQERAWGADFLYPNYKHQRFFGTLDMLQSFFAGGGGGFSKYNARPAYQKGISGVGTYDATNLWKFKYGRPELLKKPINLSGKSSGRNLPDISANADPNTGYSMFITPKNNRNSKGQWLITGGTSVVAPQMAAASVLMSDFTTNGRLGFWNPQIYRFAKRSTSPFKPLDSRTNNTNLYYTGQPGKIYNQATGLGTIDFTALNKAFNS
ncbi:S53 family peptidase [Lentilactobacillus buchneri]|uniref:Periplasmic aspartyl protease n=1 Tax=Lentilactobacillus buchneri subsp. silagei CD034 TaxID=1071400 RepID=J9W247_LENBU|nr:S53 family peptidase [Lentilactobacillus buchneri]MCC6100123.1 S53 family peptidase [Lactobacillus sp.]AFS00414.1 periplasmic aspartyl protease [Lentilactobacillus buchneri subsp. silagei CD034]MCT2900205.1 aspartyl protease [Lentilactobacillus buchneri]MCT3542097.1 aspartyl protease [Lentilactobacillus buchneri]MCT3544556.1 aspartyl protease [Lentilactobacillus buchneri]